MGSASEKAENATAFQGLRTVERAVPAHHEVVQVSLDGRAPIARADLGKIIAEGAEELGELTDFSRRQLHLRRRSRTAKKRLETCPDRFSLAEKRRLVHAACALDEDEVPRALLRTRNRKSLGCS